jgi:regulator of sigma E protease
MSAPIEWIVVALGVVLLFSLAIFVHEYGHYRVARLLGLRIDGFSIGFGPKLIGWTDRQGVLWAIRCLPLGGFVKLPQMVTSEMVEGRSDPDAAPISPWAKIAVAIAGPAMNIVFALVLACIVWWVGLPVALNHSIVGYVKPDSNEAQLGIREGDRITSVNGKAVTNWEEIQTETALALTNVIRVGITHPDGSNALLSVPAEYHADLKFKYLKLGPRDHPSVHGIQSGSPAEKAGLQVGDDLVSFNGVQVVGQRQLVDLIQRRPSLPSDIEVVRNGTRLQLKVTPYLDLADNVGRIGVTIGPSDKLTYTVQRPGPTPWKQVVGSAERIVQFVQAMTHRKESRVGVENLNGPIRIFSLLASELRVDLRRALALMVVLNVNLALLNLLPLPVLDGGHILFSLLEIITFRRIPPRLHEIVTLASGVLLLAFMLFVLVNDVRGIPLIRSLFRQETVVQPAPAP